MVYDLAMEQGITVTPIAKNEFGEKSFILTGPDNVSWQIIDEPKFKNKPVSKFKMNTVDN